MITLEYSSHFLNSRKKYLKNNSVKVEKAIKSLTFFVKNPNHPSLKMEKLVNSSVWTIRIDKGDRMFFVWKDKNTALFLDIGKHDKYRNF